MKIQLDIFLSRFPLMGLKKNGIDCANCGRPVKAYGYECDQKLVGRLLKIADHTGLTTETWYPKEVFCGTDTEFNKLKYWGLIEKSKSKWKLTRSGIHFLQNKISVPIKVWVYDDTVIDREDNLVNIEMIEPRWKFMQAHWKNDYIVPQVPIRQGQLL